MEAENLDCRKRSKIKFQHSTNPHFFQPLLPDFSTNFAIPKTFKKYLQQESVESKAAEDKTATLRDKTGKSWKVKVVLGDENDDNRHHFKEGWGDFCNDHDLQVGDFVVFKHHGNFVFEVSIFDPPTACERELVLPISSDNDEEDLQAKMKNYSRPDYNPRLRSGLEKKKGGKRKRLEKKVAFKPTGHPYFSTIVKPHNSKWGKMHMPMEFARANGMSKRWCDMVLLNEKGESWPMLLRYQKATGGYPYIGGWCKFQKVNGIKIGDSIIFELIQSGKKPIMKLYCCERAEIPIFDARAEMKGCKRVGDSSDYPEEKHSLVPTGYPYCRMVVKPHWQKGLFLPTEFARENGLFNRRCEMVLVNEKGQSWTLQLRHGREGKYAYLNGWRLVHQANGLKLGDHLIFQLINNSPEKPIMKFYINV